MEQLRWLVPLHNISVISGLQRPRPQTARWVLPLTLQTSKAWWVCCMFYDRCWVGNLAEGFAGWLGAHSSGHEAAVGVWCLCCVDPKCPSSWCSVGQGSTAGGSPRYTRHQRGSLQVRRKVNEQSASLKTHWNVKKMPGQKILQMFELRCIHTRETAEMKSPEPCSIQGVIQHSESVAGVIKLAASDDPQIVQRHEAHRHVGHQHVSLHLHDPLRRQGREWVCLSPSY